MSQFTSMTSGTITPDRLRVLGFPELFEKGTLLSGQDDLVRGSVLGRVAVGTPTGAAVAGNTGTGTLSAISAGAGAKPGVYRLVCIEPATDAGKFLVIDPDGIVIDVATVAVAFTGAVNFTISDATDFVAGDAFTITFAAGSGKYKLAVSTATDGSGVVDAILWENCDAGAGDKECLVAKLVAVNVSELIFDGSITAASVKELLRTKGIHLITPAVGA